MRQTADFDYDLPTSAIGQIPAEPRDSAKLLVASADGSYVHRRVSDLASLLRPGDIVVVNDTKVLPARFHLRKPTGGAVEILLLEPTGRHREWQALVKPGKRLKVGTQLELDGEPVLRIVDALEDGRRIVELLADDIVERMGEVPLPPYIHEPLADKDRYQTVYAREPGSVAAPTAGLHITDGVLDDLAARDISVLRVDLRVGLGTFRPISAETVEEHTMHTEAYDVGQDVWDQIQAAKVEGRRIVAVGTTTVRTLESAAAQVASVGPAGLRGRTDLFIHRGFDWKIVDVMMTNFHVPRSSLLVMIDAFVGEQWREIYKVALDENYRFLSFGDAMLLERKRNQDD